MQFPDDDLIADLRALTPAERDNAAAYIKKLARRGPVPLSNAALSVDLLLSVDPAHFRVEECDQTTHAALGVSPRGKPFAELIDSEYRHSAENALTLVRRNREVKNVRLRLLRADGSSFPVTMAARWVEPQAGAPARIDITCRDISFLKNLDNIEIFSEMLSIGIVLVNEHGLIAFANSSAEKMFGYERGELTHEPLQILLQEVGESFKLPEMSEPDQELQGRKKDGAAIAVKVVWNSLRIADQRFAVASVADITARKSIEGALRKHEEQRALIFSEGLLGDFSWNMERDEVEAHPTVFRLYGAAPMAGPVPGDWFRSRQHPDDVLETETKWRSQIADTGPLAVEFRVNGDDGMMRWIDCRAIVVRDEQGNPHQVHGVNIDITARKQAEARARSAEERLRTAVQFSKAAVWRWHIDQDVTDWFGPVWELTGKHPDDLRSFAAFKKVVFAADLAPLEAAISRCYETGSEFSYEFRIVRPDGEIRWLSGRGGLLRDTTGRVYGMTGVNFDITDRKAVEEELTQSERNFRELTNFLPQVVFTADASGALDYHNDRFYELSGISRGSGANARWVEIHSADDRQHTINAWLACVASGQSYERESRIFDSRLKEYRWYLVRAIPLRNAEGGIVRWIGTATDIHDQKTAAQRLESEVQSRTLDLKHSLALLRQREEQLERSLLEKDALLREIHHRVKNNLQIVSSLLSMQAANANGAAVAPLRDSERRISSMAMIHEQLYGTDDMQTVEFAEHSRALSESLMASMAESPAITCRLDLQPVTLTIHQAIPCALILNELLTNALKYAYPGEEGGEITIHLSTDSGSVKLTISDQGVGLPPGVNPSSPKTLGLEIVQVLVDQIEGELIVGGPPGASFTVLFRRQENNGDSANLRSRSALLSSN